MSDTLDHVDAWTERKRLYFFDDAELLVAVTRSRRILEFLAVCNREGDFVPVLAEVLSREPDLLEGEPIEPVARALLYLARHGIPHGQPTAH